MENGMFNLPINMAGPNSSFLDGYPDPLTTSEPIAQCDSFDVNVRTRVMDECPMLAHLQLTNPLGIANSGSLSSISFGRDSSLCTSNAMDDTEFHDRLTEGRLAVSTSSLAARIGFQENVEKLPNSSLPDYQFQEWSCMLHNCPSTSDPFFATSQGCGYEVPVNSKWDTRFPQPQEFGGNMMIRLGFQPHSSVANPRTSGWFSSGNENLVMGHPYGTSYSNELSLSLATSQPSITNIPDCAELSCSDANIHYLNSGRSGLEQTCSTSKELSKSYGSNNHLRFSHVILRSRYLQAIQEILAQVAYYSMQHLKHGNSSSAGVGGSGNLSSLGFSAKKGTVFTNHNMDSPLEVQVDSTLQRHAVEANISQLLALLQLVDDSYNHCIDEIHTVVSAFHAATELDPHMHVHFALQTISRLYKDLRERISNYILAIGVNFDDSSAGEKERSAETSFIHKQWALQQLKRKDHQLWRPHRGLPERSVSVLRAWMFQNFLHPYPKDAEKHLLAVKSGLTRSQVSNWFINARVRLWKPMIEEMYAEMNRRKACRNEEVAESSHRSCMSMRNHRYNI